MKGIVLSVFYLLKNAIICFMSKHLQRIFGGSEDLLKKHALDLEKIHVQMDLAKKESLSSIVSSVLTLTGHDFDQENYLSFLGDDGLVDSDSLSEFDFKIVERHLNDSDLARLLGYLSELTRRVYDIIPFDVQFVSVMQILKGKIVEQKTGEGKTLVATLASVASALMGKRVHVITTNDYLATRDGNMTRKLAAQLMIPVGIVRNNMERGEKQGNYSCPIVYSTHTTIGFDYLRDNLILHSRDKVNEFGLDFAIVDEADNVMIDDARTPLIISEASKGKSAAELLKQVDKAVRSLNSDDVEIHFKNQSFTVSDSGVEKLNNLLKLDEGYSIYSSGNENLRHLVNQSIQAHFLKFENVDYVAIPEEVDLGNGQILHTGKIELIDQSTGRILEGRRYSNGLHEAIEVKHDFEPREGTNTVAQITYQELFGLYDKLSGMTGTAHPEDDEFFEVYGLEIVSIPTNVPIKRIDSPDILFVNKESKFKGVVESIKDAHSKGQPVLVGTTSVDDSERLSSMLTEEGLSHNVLNAINHAKEAEIVAEAGLKGAITIATNMAGRGTDIRLTQEAKELGGLLVIGTNHNRSKRIDDQLRGRSGRQGNPGESVFYISLDDELMKGFASKPIVSSLTKVLENSNEKRLVLGASSSGKRFGFGAQVRSLQEESEAFDSSSRQATFKFSKVLSFIRSRFYRLRSSIVESDYENLKDVVTKEYSKWAEVGPSDLNIVESFSTFDKITKDVPSHVKMGMAATVVLKTLDEFYSSFLKESNVLRQDASLKSHAGQDTFSTFMRMVDSQYNKALENAFIEISKRLSNVKIQVGNRSPVSADEKPNVQPSQLDGLFENAAASYKDGFSSIVSNEHLNKAFSNESNMSRKERRRLDRSRSESKPVSDDRLKKKLLKKRKKR